MLEALLAAGIVPDVLVGTSIGAVNAAYLAAGPSVERTQGLADIWRNLSRDEFFPLTPSTVARAVLGGAFFSQAPLRRLFEREIPYQRIEEAATALRIVATRCERRAEPPNSLRSVVAGLDQRAGQAILPLRRAAQRLDRTAELAAIQLRVVASRVDHFTEQVFAEGPVVDALLASSALPLVFPPYRYGGHVYVDGGLSDYVPLIPALQAGARVVYVLSLWTARTVPAPEHPARTAVYQSLGSRLWRRISPALEQVRQEHPDVQVVELPAPFTHVGLRDFSRAPDLIDLAREHTRRFLDQAPGDLGQTA